MAEQWYGGLRWYPVLFSSFTPLYLAASNPGEYEWFELVLLVAGLVAVSSILYLAVHLILRAKGQLRAAPAVAFVIVGWLFNSLLFLGVLGHASGIESIGRLRFAIPFGGICTVVACWIIMRKHNERIDRALSVFVTVLLVWSLATVGWTTLKWHRWLDDGRLPSSLTEPLEETSPRRRPSELPDVYLIVLDGYANGDVLRTRFGFANRAFEDSLRRLGVTIPAVVRSNYTHTAPSLASFLNLEYVNDIRSGSVPSKTLAFHYLIDHNRTTVFLKSLGYHFYFFPSSRFPGTRRSSLADVQFRPEGVGTLSVFMNQSVLAYAVRLATIPGRLTERLGFGSTGAQVELAAIRGLKDIVERGGPKLAFAHLMLTHHPYYFDRHCARSVEATRSSAEEPRAYIGQIECANALLLDIVTTIRTRSTRPAIVVLQADHGVGSVVNPRKRVPVEASFSEERFAAFGAYYLPNGDGAALGDTVTPVGVMRFIMRSYFDIRLEARPNAGYWPW